jgi:MFS family permease
LFVLVSILFSIALVPLLLNIGPVPASNTDEKIGFRELLTASPLGVFGCALTGFSNGAVLGMGAVYAKSRGFDVAMISVFISTVVVGGVLFQWPVGRLSDRWDRRWVLAIVTFGATVCALSTVFISSGAVVPIFAAALLLGGMTFPMYSLSISLSNDQIPFEKMVAASATLVLATGLGAVAGPSSVGYAMARLGPWAFFGVLAVVHGLYGVYILYRIRYYSAVPEDLRGEHAYLTRTSPVMAAAAFEHFADPETDSVDENEPEVEDGFF